MAAHLKLGAAVEAKLLAYASRIGNGSVDVGFLGGRAVYEDGTSVAQVAFWNEFGTKGRKLGESPSAEQIGEGIRREPERVGGSPPRPFFRRMVSAKSSSWGGNLGQALIASSGDGEKALALMGEQMSGELTQSINELFEPPLKPSTIRRKGFTKPLIDTTKMIHDVAYRVNG